MLPSLHHESGHLAAIEGDRRALRIVLVVGRRGARRVIDIAHLRRQQVEQLARGCLVLIKALDRFGRWIGVRHRTIIPGSPSSVRPS
jgi:hypothetical protein